MIRLLRAVVSQDIMSIVQNPSVVDSSNLQTELDRTKERLENCIIKKENEYAKLWNDWYKKCEECKYDKISYDKAYNDMQHKIERLQAQLGDLKGKSTDTPCVSNTLDPLSQKLENENVELELRLRAQLFDKVSDQKDTNKGMSANTKFAKQSILGKPPSSSRPKPYAVPTLPNSTAFPKVGETNALSNPVTSNSVPSSRESTVVNNERVIAPGIFRINPFKANRVDNFVPNKHVKTSVRTKPIIVSQPHDDCVRQYVNGMSSRKKNQSANVSKSANQKTHKAQKNLKSQSDCSKGDNACTSNPQEPINKRFPSSTFSMTDNNPFFKEKENVRFSAFILNNEKRNLFGLALVYRYDSKFVSSSQWLVIKCQIATRSSKKKGSVRFSALYLKKKRNLLVFTSVDMIVMTSMVELESLFGHLFDALSNGENQVVTKSSAVTTADASDKCQQQQDSTSSTSTLHTYLC
ncbi:hypothetical protein Tco_0057734 [Tanacetum coccineum]